MPVTHTARGREATRLPTRRQKPCCSSTPASPACGMVSNGDQNALRPVIASSAGRTVSIDSIASTTPTAPTGPRPAVELTSASDRHSSAAITVPPDAMIAGPALFIAIATASCLSSWRRSSSR